MVQCDHKSNTGYQLDQSEHFQMFLYCLGLPNKFPSKQWTWDASVFYGIRRKRVSFRSHLDPAVPLTSPPPGDEAWGPLIYLDYQISPLAPLLRTRGYTSGGALKLSWTGYQPYALMWNYAFFGGKRAFALLCQLPAGSKFPKLPWASIVPAHFLPIWKEFLANLQAVKTKATRRDELVDQLITIFHNPNIVLPMQILTVQEVRKLSGLENILTVERHGPMLLTDKVVRDFCGNSFHPRLIDAALGSDEQFREWASGLNDAQPCHCTTPPLHEAFAKYQHLLRLVLEQGAKRGIQLKSDRIDFEAKWHSYGLNAQAETAGLPLVQQPTIFSFLNVAKASPEVEQSRLRRPDIPFGDKDLTNVLTQIHLEWLIESSVTYENVALSARMLQLAVGSGVGFRLEDRAVKNKYAELLQEYTAVENLQPLLSWSLSCRLPHLAPRINFHSDS